MALSGHRTGYLNGTTSGWVARSVFWYGSNWYLVALDTSAVKIRVYKSPDGLTWTEQDASNALSHSGATDSYDVGMPLSGTSAGKLHIAYRTATNTVRVQIFDMATDTFAGTDVGGANASTVVAADFGMSVAVRSDGDVLVLMRNNSNSDIYVLRYEGSSWASTTINTTNTSIPLDLCMTGNSDMAHILWYENVSFDWTTRSISNANALGTVTDIDSSVMTTPIFGSTMGYVNDGGTHRLIAPVPDSDGGLDISYAVSATTPTWTKINSVSPTTVTDPGIMGTVIVPYNSSFHALWSGDGRGEIHYDFSDDYATPAWHADQTPISGLGNNPAVSAAAGSTG
ncbi:MAG TPA: hypothetical protein PK819_14710, partial [Thermomicrobiales bacterium]|nr:hypothetical protein [Thermomicrobiales bacterium]